MLHLQNGCTCSEPSIHPKNWKTGGPSLLKKIWYIQYYFRDPDFADKHKHGKLVILKNLHEYKTLEERRAAAQSMLNAVRLQATKFQYNPYHKTIVEPVEDLEADLSQDDIDPATPFFQAIRIVFAKLDFSVKTRRDIKSCIKFCEMATEKIGYNRYQISSVRRKHIKILLDQIGKLQFIDSKGKLAPVKWTANRFNVYRKYLHRLFEELIELEATEINPELFIVIIHR